MADECVLQQPLREAHREEHAQSINDDRSRVNYRRLRISIILRRMFRKAVLTAASLLLVALSGCGMLEQSGREGTAVSPTPATPTPDATAVPQNTPAFTVPTPTAATAPELRIWLPPETAVRTETGAGLLSEQLLAFNSQYPDVTIVVEQKPLTGPGGTLSYLRNARGVAPDILPQLIAAPGHMISGLAAEQLIYPLGDQLEPSDLEQLYPAADTFARANDQIYAYPFTLTNLPHLVYDTNTITRTLPLTWERLIQVPDQNLVFPADGPDGALLALQFYLAAGGSLTNDAGQPILEQGPLTVALQQLEAGHDSGFILPQSGNLTTLDETWLAFQTGGASIARTNSDLFLSRRASATGAPGFTVTAGIDRPLPPLVDSWSWAVTTSDPTQRELATELITYLTAPENLGPWSRASQLLPARRDALQVWPDDDAYVRFIRQELERAEPVPIAPTSRIFTVLGDAVFQVVSGTQSAPAAAAEAVAALVQ